jgi:altronate dehydratase small subunit
MKKAILMNNTDNVATALTNFEENIQVKIVLSSQQVIKEIKTNQVIAFGHKLAVEAIDKGQKVIKYGEVIGHATKNIAIGDHVHIHNVNSNRMQMPEVWYRKEE